MHERPEQYAGTRIDAHDRGIVCLGPFPAPIGVLVVERVYHVLAWWDPPQEKIACGIREHDVGDRIRSPGGMNERPRQRALFGPVQRGARECGVGDWAARGE